jgi:hypothetical protein
VGGGVAPTTSYTRKDAWPNRRSRPTFRHQAQARRNLLGHLENGVGFYHFSYNGSTKAFVGVIIAQEVQQGSPRGGRVRLQRLSDCELRKLGLKFKSYKQWIASGAHVPKVAEIPH